MRKSGILMHISCLSSPYGIGTLGAEAYRFVEFLERTNQKYWQVLPIGPTSFGDSPYQTFSAFAGNPYFIDLDFLKNENLLTEEDLNILDKNDTSSSINYENVYNTRFIVLRKAYNRFVKTNKFYEFIEKNNFWLEDYALFMALKNENNGRPWFEWKQGLRLRYKKDILKAKEELKDEIDFQNFLQFKFFEHWENLKNYANKKNIEIIGDIPIYVSYDSSDVWSNPKDFLLDKDRLPILVAGCPPDAFTEDGQLWGNPIYRWNVMKKNGYDWWIKRVLMSSQIYDVTRIDHFRGFEAYYTIEYGKENAKKGEWKKGPGIDLFNKIKEKLGDVKIIAEDLGFLTEEVYELLRESGYPGMKILQFGFDPYQDSEYLPQNYQNNCIVYTGTHDNDTLKGWLNTQDKNQIKFIKDYLSCPNDDEIIERMIKLAFMSTADTVIIPIQDYLELGSEARINIPSTVGTNWIWRLDKNLLTVKLEERIKELTKLYSR